ncbi:hypothetical protein ZWY2020_036856 [Hordeum vulgare]|nr:hypothetical protein ZWY2020_036856 [Hordeum vulgare]
MMVFVGCFNSTSIAANLASCLTDPYLMVCMISSTACDGHFLVSSLHFPRPTAVSNHQVANFSEKVSPWLQVFLWWLTKTHQPFLQKRIESNL